jgi:hypothetical protein
MRGFSKASAPPLFLEDENLASPARLGRCMLLRPAASKHYSSTTKNFQNSKFKIQKLNNLKIGSQGVDVEHFAIGVWAI